MKRYGILALPVFIFLLIIAVMHLVDPQTVGPAGILIIFTLLYLFFLSLFSVLIFFGSHVVAKQRIFSINKAIRPQKAYYIATVVSCFPVFLLAIMSIGELRVIDVILVCLFVFLASFYVARRT